MYTEDDEKVDVKEDNSNIKYSDFYTSFNDIEKEDKKGKKTKKQKKQTPSKPEEVPLKEEEDYQDFYGSNNEEEVPVNDNDNRNNLKLIIAIILFILLIMLVVFIFVIKGRSVKGDIELGKDNITLEAGKTEYISYNVVDTESVVTSKFVSSDETVAVVNDNGEITAVGPGEADITVYYTIDGVTREKNCHVEVTGTGDQKLTLNLKLANGKDNAWTNKDVVITPEASSVFGVTSIQYAINCSDKCEYKDVVDNKITISTIGTTKVKVVAKDKKKQEATKEVTIKIDKEAPTAALIGDTNIKSNKDVEVCATCTDKSSGCKQAKVCKKFTSSKTNQTITVEDQAGNKSTSKAFNVTINKPATATCSLSVSSDGKVTATVKGEATYYGFNSSYSGSNALSEKLKVVKDKNGNAINAVTLKYYYVKSTSGTTSKCSISVLQKCTCSKESCCTYKSQ